MRLHSKCNRKPIKDVIKNALKAPLANQRGVALMMTIFAVTVMMYIAVEIVRTSSIEYVIASKNLNQVRAKYSARAGIEMGALRVLLFQKAKIMAGEQLGDKQDLLDLIWQLPFNWPPFLSEDLSVVARSRIEKQLQESLFKGEYSVQLAPVGGKIDLNALGSRSPTLAKATQIQLLNFFEQKMEADDDFSERYSTFDFNQLVQNLTDWIDADSNAGLGGNEIDAYPDLPPEIRDFPPNHEFKTIEEVRMVALVNDEIFNLLKEHTTVYGTQGINVNKADKSVLMGIDPQITDEVADAIIKQRQLDPEEGGGPFKKMEDFIDFLEDYNIDKESFNATNAPLFFESPINFTIKSVGAHSNSVVTIEAVTYDKTNLTNQLTDLFVEEDKQAFPDSEDQNQESNPDSQQNPATSGTPDNNDPNQPPQKTAEDESKKKKEKKVPSGRPTLIYWNEY